MKCVLLVAGVGRRLRPLTARLPKCLLPVGGKPLLHRTLTSLLKAGVRELIVVTGFESKKIQLSVRRHFPKAEITFVHNARFARTNNAVSLSLAMPFVAGDKFLLLDGDLLFSETLLQSFLSVRRKPNRLAVRVEGKHDAEEIKVRINRWDHIQEIGKHVRIRETYGESIGMELFSANASRRLFEILSDRIKGRTGAHEFYESAFQQLIDEGERLWAVDCSRFPSAEIDTREDLVRAERFILPLLGHA